jgi:hypothetical protein
MRSTARSYGTMGTTRTRMPKKKMTPEERAAELARREDLTRRLREAIERHKASIAEKRAAAEGS